MVLDYLLDNLSSGALHDEKDLYEGLIMKITTCMTIGGGDPSASWNVLSETGYQRPFRRIANYG